MILQFVNTVKCSAADRLENCYDLLFFNVSCEIHYQNHTYRFTISISDAEKLLRLEMNYIVKVFAGAN